MTELRTTRGEEQLNNSAESSIQTKKTMPLEGTTGVRKKTMSTVKQTKQETLETHNCKTMQKSTQQQLGSRSIKYPILEQERGGVGCLAKVTLKETDTEPLTHPWEVDETNLPHHLSLPLRQT